MEVWEIKIEDRVSRITQQSQSIHPSDRKERIKFSQQNESNQVILEIILNIPDHPQL